MEFGVGTKNYSV